MFPLVCLRSHVGLVVARVADGVPEAWVKMMKNAMRVAGEKFTARRMVEEYVEKYYVPSMNGDAIPDDPPTA